MSKSKNSVVVITGGGKGIGKAIASYLIKNGSSVIICGRDTNSLTKSCKELDPTGKKCASTKADVSKLADCKKLIAFAVKKFGKLDVLINNAGVYGDIGELQDANFDNWTNALNTNLLGAVYCTKFAINAMKKNGGGKIINFAGAGIGSKRTLPRFSSYYTSKAGVAAFTEVIAAEVDKDNIQINAIAPGAIYTGFAQYLIAQGPEKAGLMEYNKAIEQQKTGGESLDNVCRLISFLCSSESNNVSGRLLSAKWDKLDILKSLPKDGDMFKLRRIDNDLFYGK